VDPAHSIQKEIAMSYKEKVQDKIGGSVERPEERMELWEQITKAYEEGGLEQVEAMLAEKAEGLRNSFEEVMDKLQKML